MLWLVVVCYFIQYCVPVQIQPVAAIVMQSAAQASTAAGFGRESEAGL